MQVGRHGVHNIMITLTREEAQQVLDALEGVKDMAWDSDTVAGRKLIETLRARLAQPESEPVAWTVGGLITDFSRDFSAYKTKTYTRPLYTAPPQRERVQFPTMLRKMWSGSEVQAWLDENLNKEKNHG